MWNARSSAIAIALTLSVGRVIADPPVADPKSVNDVKQKQSWQQTQAKLSVRYSQLTQKFSSFPHSGEKLREIEASGSAWFFRNCVTYNQGKGNVPASYTALESAALLFQGEDSLRLGYFVNPKGDAKSLIASKADSQLDYQRSSTDSCRYQDRFPEYYVGSDYVEVRVDAAGKTGMLMRESRGDGQIAKFHFFTICDSEKGEDK